MLQEAWKWVWRFYVILLIFLTKRVKMQVIVGFCRPTSSYFSLRHYQGRIQVDVSPVTLVTNVSGQY